MGGLLGLDYTAVHAVIQMTRSSIDVFRDVRHIEAGALAEIRESQDVQKLSNKSDSRR